MCVCVWCVCVRARMHARMHARTHASTLLLFPIEQLCTGFLYLLKINFFYFGLLAEDS